MKKSTATEANRIRTPGLAFAEKTASRKMLKAKAVKLSPARKAVTKQPAGLLAEEFRDSEAYTVSFEYFNLAAREVFVSGSFNDWQPRATPLAPQRGGKWSTQLLLKPGEYQYRFVVDGQWQDDPMAGSFVANPFGGLNAVVKVEEMRS